jgi:hypothetical protein
MMTIEQQKEEAGKVAQIVYDKSGQILSEAVAEALCRQPTAIEYAIAAAAFLMGGTCVAEAMIEGLEKLDVIGRN